MTQQSLYQQVAQLNRQKHKKLQFTPQKDLSFTQKMNSVPVNGLEFFVASRDLPIVFIKNKDDSYMPLALLSLSNEGHYLLTDKGAWNADIYMPVFLRRYPFTLTAKGAVCIDTKAPHFANKNTGTSLLTEDGEFSSVLNSAMKLLTRFDKQAERTREYMEACKAADIFKPCNFNVKQGKNKALRLDGLFIIDEQKLIKLPAETVAEWHKKGWLAWSYAQIHSMGAMERLVRRQKDHDKATVKAS
jgi:hypothetical protein